MAERRSKVAGRVRERILGAAYDLFVQRGINAVGVDAVLAKSRCAKASLYSNFGSKTGLVLAVLNRREQVWSKDWLEAGIRARAATPEDRLLAVFDLLDGWCRSPDFEGCPFLHALAESTPGEPIHRAAAKHLANVRALLRDLASEAGLAEPERFARVWQMLMCGSIMAAEEGHRTAALDGKRGAQFILAGWPRR